VTDEDLPQQLDLFGYEEAHRKKLEKIYKTLLNPPEAFTRLSPIMEKWRNVKPGTTTAGANDRPDGSPESPGAHRKTGSSSRRNASGGFESHRRLSAADEQLRGRILLILSLAARSLPEPWHRIGVELGTGTGEEAADRTTARSERHGVPTRCARQPRCART
jgi:hypothetical protein